MKDTVVTNVTLCNLGRNLPTFLRNLLLKKEVASPPPLKISVHLYQAIKRYIQQDSTCTSVMM